MNSKKTALSFAAVGTAAGVAGLVLLASPAGAGEAPPALPPISADALVESVLSTEVPALGGSVELRNNLGLPIPGLPTSMGGGDAVRVFADGEGRGRISIPGRGGETTVVDDGSTVWVWSSQDKTVQKVPHGADQDKATPLEGKFADPATAARDLVNAMRADSTVDVDGTARVAGRPVYQLVLAPKPTERTLLREIRVSVDSETRVPLRLEVLANGQADPALEVGFTEFSDGPQDANLFRFSPPAGATVTEHDPNEEFKGQSPDELFSQLDGQTVGEGWDTVLTGKLPEGALAMSGGSGNGDATALLSRFAKQVHGDFGTGWVISAKVGTALITEDGRVAIGAVPQQVLTEALGK
ncbi:MAG: outer membrane lipoprotein carrier protein LolA [Actinophytocola sp.]|uniref:LolA family protein n=1 Tax=Actinophytocola sp. TaxID=1872138 RepID=UPI001326842F|nr:outer membrane lipoprotein carrier protein LolA [Actinophytocola sp.]MPZ79461.1 outer membrane lipoprotein carrier protein LolA [Actinophytocola sp.]